MKKILLLPLLLAITAATPDPVHDLAGRYSSRFRNALVTGEQFWSENIVEIVPVDAGHAYLRFSLQFYNGHSCSLAGVAAARGDGLVYQGPPDDTVLDMPTCRLTVRREGHVLAWDDDHGTCKAHCGARGTFLRDDLPWSSRRPISYLATLRRSPEYRDAVAEWRADGATK